LATGGEVCAECRESGRAFDYCRSAGYYKEPLREAVLALKYRRKTRLAAPLAELMVERLNELRREADLPAPDCLVPVPLHWRRRWRRGFNQSLLLCQEMARLLDRPPVEEVLVRTRATRPQAGLKRSARFKNLHGAFALRRGACVEGRNVVLVDDVMTTGATLSECAKMLKKAKCATVLCLTAARQVAW
jgi:ComF family protein